ncbi:MAG: adenylosuccinate lyase, partial [Clostridia bacterium]|nr:adenylosuccinate lyase [Clostridia bacterium]
MSDRVLYENPLNTRYASREMQENFGDAKRFRLWRELWIALAESEMELGLPILQSQIDELKAHISDIDYEKADAYEKQVRHDVMAHVKTYGEAAPSAKGIIHLGATSCFVDCNSELIVMRDGLAIVLRKLVNVMEKLKKFALRYKDVPTLGFTHLQPAQLTTVGKRATLWLQDLMLDYENLQNLLSHFRLR